MTRPIRLVGISGSLRKASFNTALLRAAAELLPEGASLEILSIRDVPFYDGDVEAAGFPPAVTALQQAILAADGLVIASPEYNHSVPGVLKNAIDWLSRTQPKTFAGKPLALMGATPGRLGTARMQPHLRQIFVALDADTLNKPELMIGGAFQSIVDSKLVAEPIRELVGRQMAALCARIEAKRGQA